MKVAFFVPGLPVAQGSMKAVPLPKTRRAVVVHSNESKLLPWRRTIHFTCSKAWGMAYLARPFDGPVELDVRFELPRPRTVKRDEPTVPPDLDKLLRAVLDALTGVAFQDDAQVVRLTCSKVYGVERVGVSIVVSGLEAASAAIAASHS